MMKVKVENMKHIDKNGKKWELNEIDPESKRWQTIIYQIKNRLPMVRPGLPKWDNFIRLGNV